MFEARIKLGQYLYLKHGAKVVFLGRFVALLRILAAFLAGVNRMPWRAFLIANDIGSNLNHMDSNLSSGWFLRWR
jgi:membrane protein DedA with SNARE-associated domain